MMTSHHGECIGIERLTGDPDAARAFRGDGPDRVARPSARSEPFAICSVRAAIAPALPATHERPGISTAGIERLADR